MKYLSVCAGIEAASVAWHHMGWEPVAFSEIEKFPSAVLAHHYPNVPNWGDMTKFKEWPDANIDVLVGGTPCQSFSVAGLRKGLDDPRGNLMLTYLAIAKRYWPEWLVWENVPGVLSSEGGRDFAALLRGLDELGYGWAYRVLDAQYFGVAQRRRRVFVVGHLGNWQRAAAVLFERHSLSGHPAPSRQARKGTAGGALPSVAGSLDTQCGGGKLTHQSMTNGHVIGTITARMFNALGARDVEEGALLPVAFDAFNQADTGDLSKTVASRNDQDTASLIAQPISFGAQMSVPQTDVNLVQTLQAKNPMAVMQPIPYDLYQITAPVNRQNRKPSDPCHTLARDNAAHAAIAIQGTLIGRSETAGPQGSGADVSGAMFTLTKTDVHAVAFAQNQVGEVRTGEVLNTLNTNSNASGRNTPMVAQYIGGVDYENNAHGMDEATGPLLKGSPTGGGRPLPAIATAMQVRRLTPEECERLQGFPDGYTNIPWRGKPESPDGPRYKALGNSMAVPCMVWIGERINEVSKL